MPLSTRLRAMMKHEVVADDVDALLRGSGQIEDLRQQLDARREALQSDPKPWEAYERLGSAFAAFWISNGLASISRSLKECGEGGDAGTSGYMAQVSHDQAMALLSRVGEYIAFAQGALADPNYDPGIPLPVALSPRVDSPDRCPVSHLRGMVQAAHYLDEQAQVEIQTYAAATGRAEAPEKEKSLATRLQGEVAAAHSHLEMATQMVTPILDGQSVSADTHQTAEDNLWSALAAAFVLGQVIALPKLLDQAPVGSYGSRSNVGPGHRPPPGATVNPVVDRQSRWCLSSPMARSILTQQRRTGWAEDELDELWGHKHWRLSTEEQRLMDETSQLEAQGAVRATSYMAECPFDPVWSVLRPVTVLGQRLDSGSQFAYNHHPGKGGLITGFHTVNDFQQCEDD